MKKFKGKILLLVISTLAIALGFMSGYVAQEGFPVNGVISGDPVIVIDAGHGGFDGGATSDDGISEKNINLAIALHLKDYCKLYGYEVVMIREADTDIGGNPQDSLSARKKADMENRLQIMYDNPNSVFVSVHQNKFPQTQYWGAQVFYTTNDGESSKLAQLIQDNIKAQLQPTNDRAIKAGNDQMYLLANAKSPSVIVECGFLSNQEELQRLVDPVYQQQLAYCIFLSLVEHLI